MDCTPHWLSPNNQCSSNISTFNSTKSEILDLIWEQFMLHKKKWSLTIAEKKCQKPCLKMTNTLSLAGESILNGHTIVILRFDDQVRIERKIVAYTWFNFIIDVGSSLGLWLGLSALGIFDIITEASMMAKKWLKKRFKQVCILIKFFSTCEKSQLTLYKSTSRCVCLDVCSLTPPKQRTPAS